MLSFPSPLLPLVPTGSSGKYTKMTQQQEILGIEYAAVTRKPDVVRSDPNPTAQAICSNAAVQHCTSNVPEFWVHLGGEDLNV